MNRQKIFDIEASLHEFNENFMDWLKHAGPFGSENPPPVFKVTATQIEAVRWLKGQHLKLTLADAQSKKVDALAFFAHTHRSLDLKVGEMVELLAEPTWNYFRGERRLQLVIRDLRKSRSLC